MKVTATQKGYYAGMLREPGESFEIDDHKTDEDQANPDAYSELWMTSDDYVEPDTEEDTGGSYTCIHRGNGKWDVLDPEGDLIEEGDNLKKAAAHKMVDELNTELAEEE